MTSDRKPLELEQTVLGLELGSTRIKAVLLDRRHVPIASGSYEWENQLVNGLWTYSMEAVHTGVRACFANLKKNVEETFGVKFSMKDVLGMKNVGEMADIIEKNA